MGEGQGGAFHKIGLLSPALSPPVGEEREKTSSGRVVVVSRSAPIAALETRPSTIGFNCRSLSTNFSFMANYLVAQLDEVAPQKCPCGFARRAFASSPGMAASVHQVDIHEDARAHYHKQMVEIYVVLEGEGHIELDGQLVPLKPMTAVYIQPGCRHRAIGKLRILNIPIPAFDADDEWFD